MKDKYSVQKAYDRIAEEYNEAADGTNIGNGKDKAVSQFMSLLEGEENLVLDAGCGATPFNASEVETIGLDFSKEQLVQSESSAPLIHGDMVSLPFKEDVFSGIVAFFSMIHIPLEDREAVYEEFSRTLQKGGVVLFTEGTEEWVGTQEDWLGAGAEMQWEIAGREATKKHLETAGFEIIDVVPVVDKLGDTEGTKLFFIGRYN